MGEINLIIGRHDSYSRPSILLLNVKRDRMSVKQKNADSQYVEKLEDLIYRKEWINDALINKGMVSFLNFTKDEYDKVIDIIDGMNSDPINPINLQIYYKIYELYVHNGLSIEEISESLYLTPRQVTNFLLENKIPKLNGSRYQILDPDLMRIYKQIRYYSPDSITFDRNNIKVYNNYRVNIKLSFDVAKRQSTKYEINNRDIDYNWVPVIVPEYSDCDLDKDFVHWRIRTEFNNKLEARVSSLRLMKFCIMSADKSPKHPDHFVNDIKNNKELMLHTSNFWKIVEHFFGNEEMKYYTERPSQLLHIITDCHDLANFTNSSIITKVLYQKRLKVDDHSIGLVYEVLNKSEIKSIYDPNPGVGTLMAVCSMLNIDYYYDSDHDFIFERGISNGILEFYDNKFKKYDGRKVDACMSLNLPISWYEFMKKNSSTCATIINNNNKRLIMQKYKVITNELLLKIGSLITFQTK